ncbi:hydroxymethylglutaryl-CoA lyase [Rhodococcus sp. WS4]|nr:hydroxymethylglutaryl-CoA lyase [Rhodococcus sp. WS4]
MPADRGLDTAPEVVTVAGGGVRPCHPRWKAGPPLTSTNPVNVVVCEALLRDGIQGWNEPIPTSDKIGLLEAIVASGIQEIDVTSFVPPSVVPQFSDSLDVLGAVPDGVRTRVLTVNLKGTHRVVEAHERTRHIDLCGIPYSVSEKHNLANLRRDHQTHRREVAAMVEQLRQHGIETLLGVATAYGCPIQGEVPREEVLATVEWAHALGIRSMMFGDTTGMADPRTVRELFSTAVEQWPDVEFIAHFHDNRGCGVANAIAAIESGARTVDASLGGVGGEPAAVDQGFVGESGNVATEDLVAVLEQMGVSTGIDPQALLRAGALAERTLGRPLHSRVQRAGVIPFTPTRKA